MTNTNLPELPAPSLLARDTYTGIEVWGYESHEMRAYALAALAQSGQGEAVAWMWDQATHGEGDVRGRQWVPSIGRLKPSMPWMVQNLVPLFTRPQPEQPLIARNLGEWQEDDGPVMWWAWNGRDWAGEPAWIGTPNDSDWPGYHTHWTGHPEQPIQDKRVEHSGSEPWYGHRFCEVRKGLWRCGCGKDHPRTTRPARQRGGRSA